MLWEKIWLYVEQYRDFVKYPSYYHKKSLLKYLIAFVGKDPWVDMADILSANFLNHLSFHANLV